MRKLTEVEHLFREHYSSMYKAANHIVKDDQVARDIVQEVFYQFWKMKDDLDVNKDIDTFLFKNTVRLSVDHIKEHSDINLLAEELKLSKTFSYSSFSRDLKAGMMNVLLNLSPKCQAIFMMSKDDGMENKEIADTMGISLKAVENQMGIALKHLNLHRTFSRRKK